MDLIHCPYAANKPQAEGYEVKFEKELFLMSFKVSSVTFEEKHVKYK